MVDDDMDGWAPHKVTCRRWHLRRRIANCGAQAFDGAGAHGANLACRLIVPPVGGGCAGHDE